MELGCSDLFVITWDGEEYKGHELRIFRHAHICIRQPRISIWRGASVCTRMSPEDAMLIIARNNILYSDSRSYASFFEIISFPTADTSAPIVPDTGIPFYVRTSLRPDHL